MPIEEGDMVDRKHHTKLNVSFPILCSVFWFTSYCLGGELSPYAPPGGGRVEMYGEKSQRQAESFPKQNAPPQVLPEYKTRVNKFIEEAKKLSPSDKATLKGTLIHERNNAVDRNDWDQVLYYRDLIKGIEDEKSGSTTGSAIK